MNLIKLPILGLVALLFTSSILQAQPINVPNDYATISAAVAAANNNDTIEIEPNVYTGAQNTNVVIDKPLTIIGLRVNGNATMVTIDCQKNPDTRAFTILGNISGTVTIEEILFVNGNTSSAAPQNVSSSHVSLNPGQSSLIHTDCSTANQNKFRGGAILIASDADVVITDCIFEDNTSEAGGAISIAHCYPNGEITIENNTFRRDSANVSNLDRGGAICGILSSSNLVKIVDNVFDSCVMLTNTFPSPNLAYGGGAIYLESNDNGTSEVLARTTIERNTFRGNTSGNDGGAMLLRGFNHAKVYNNSFTGNNSVRGAVAINLMQRRGDTCTIRNNTLENNLTGSGTPLILTQNHLYINTGPNPPIVRCDNNIIKPISGQAALLNGPFAFPFAVFAVRNNNINTANMNTGFFTMSGNYNQPSTYVSYPNYQLGDFHQSFGSPDTNMGLSVAEPDVDIDDARRDVTAPDCGVDEFNTGGKIYTPELVNNVTRKNDSLHFNIISTPNSVVFFGIGLNRIPPTPVPNMNGLLELDLINGYIITIATTGNPASLIVTDANGFARVSLFLDNNRNNGTFYCQVATIDAGGTVNLGNTIEVKIRD